MASKTSFDVLVIGGGPAGIAAAVRAAECGVCVGLVDDNQSFGGQIWRGEFDAHRKDEGGEAAGEHSEASKWRLLLAKAPVTKLSGFRIVDQIRAGKLLAEGEEELRELDYQRLILATGARERFLPFPGWTLPNVMGAGGLQAMVKSGLPISGRRIVVAGSGPLLLAVAAYLRKHGADIPIICEQASWPLLLRFGVSLLRHPKKLKQAAQLKKDLSGIPFAANTWPVRAKGKNALEAVTISRGGKQQSIPCDYLACGFHLVPNTELAQLLGCQLAGDFVGVDDLQETTVKGIFCAGEPVAIGGVDLALVAGQIAGLAAAGHKEKATKLFGERKKALRFARALDRASRLRGEIGNLPAPDTIVCRCEDVPYLRIQPYKSWRAAKLHTRCGMGPCQGRICGPAVQFLFGWTPDSVRPPIFAARVESLAAFDIDAPAAPAALTGESE